MLENSNLPPPLPPSALPPSCPTALPGRANACTHLEQHAPIRCVLSPASQKEKPGSVVNDMGFVLWTFVVCGKRKEETVEIVKGLQRAQRSPRGKQGRQWMDQGSDLALHAYLLTFHPTHSMRELGALPLVHSSLRSTQNHDGSSAQTS